MSANDIVTIAFVLLMGLNLLVMMLGIFADEIVKIIREIKRKY